VSGGIWRRADRIVGRRIGGELVLVPILQRGTDADAIFHLNKTAAFVWEQLDGERDLVEIASLMTGRFDVELARAQAECAELMETLKSLGAVTCVGAGTAGSEAP
jgi:hypothetical protein